MKVVNFWKTLFCAALAVTAFSACSDDDEEGGYSGMPEITVNGGESVTVAGKLEGGKLEQTVEVVSKGDWTLTFKNSGDSQWVTPSAMSGKTGTTQLTFTLGQASGERSAILVLTASSMVEGFPLTDEATIKIVQSDSSIPTGNALYSEDCGKEEIAKPYPYADKYEKWSRQGTLDQSGVVYGGSGAKVSWGTGSYLPAEDEVTEVSGPAFAYIGYADNVLDITNINVGTASNFTFTFTALLQTAYSNGPVFGEVSNSTIKFYVSANGEGGDDTFAPVTFTSKKVASGSWYICTAEFKLPAGTSTDKIAVRFTGFDRQTENQLRLDDFKLYEGGNGSELVVPSVDYTKGTVAEAIAAGAGKNYEVAATVVAMHTQGILIGDASGVMLAFLGEAPAVAVNDAVTVKGTTELRNGVIQFGKEGLSVAKTGTGSYNTPAPEVMDGTAVTAYIATALENKAVYKYVKYNGEFTVSGNYYNVVIAGTTTKGSVAYGKSEWASFNGKPVTVEGWLLGGTANYLQTMATSVTVDSSTPIVEISAPQQFAATSPVAQTLNYTVTNTTASAVTFAIEGTNADKFELGAKTDNSIQVSAKGNNTTDVAYTANLVAKVAGVTLASVELKQAASNAKNYVPVTVAPADWSGDYVVGYPDGEVCYILKDKYSGASATRSTFTYEKLQSPAFDKTNIVYDASYKTITIAKIAGTDFYSIKYGDMYVGWTTATKNSCEFSTTAPSSSTPDYQWTPTIKDGLIVLTCTTHETGKANRTLQFNANSGQERFAIYASTQKSIMLYKL